MNSAFRKIKHLLNRWEFIIPAYIAILTFSSLGYSFFEKKPLADSIWWAIVTGMTVGYGDMFPVTVGGRLVAVFLMHSVPFFIAPLIIAKIITTVLENRDAWTHEEQERLMNDLAHTRQVVTENAFTSEEQARVVERLDNVINLLDRVHKNTEQLEEAAGIDDDEEAEAV